MAKENIEQPDLDAQRLFDELMEAEPETIDVFGKKARIGWLHKDTERKMSHIMVKYAGDDADKNIVKWYSAIRMDVRSGFLTWFCLTFLWWAYWRWLWYIRRERGTMFQMRVVEASKKKVQERSHGCVLTTLLMVGATDLMMAKAAHEVGQAGRAGERVTP